VKLVVTDVTGRAMSPRQPIRWRHVPISGPLYIVEDTFNKGTIDIPDGWKNPYEAQYGLGRGTTIQPLYASGNNILPRIKVFNGTPYDAYVGGAPAVILKVSHRLRNASHVTAPLSVVVPSGNLPRGCIAPNRVLWPDLTCAPPFDNTSRITKAEMRDAVHVIGIDPAGQVERARIPAPPDVPGAPDVWLVPAPTGAFSLTHLYVVSDAWTVLHDQPNASEYVIQPRSGGEVTVFGRRDKDWFTVCSIGRDGCCDDVPGDPDCCTAAPDGCCSREPGDPDCCTAAPDGCCANVPGDPDCEPECKPTRDGCCSGVPSDPDCDCRQGGCVSAPPPASVLDTGRFDRFAPPSVSVLDDRTFDLFGNSRILQAVDITVDPNAQVKFWLRAHATGAPVEMPQRKPEFIQFNDSDMSDEEL